MDSLGDLIKRHRELDFLLQGNKESGKLFISDWNCKHPFYTETFKNLEIDNKEVSKYNYIREEKDLLELISNFHSKNENKTYSSKEIIVSNGSTTIISAFFIWLRTNNIKEVYYIPPLYFTFHFFAKIYDIAFRPITRQQLIEDNIKLNLPNKKSTLLFTDPLWYAGLSVKNNTINKIADWQKSTGSTILVDGSFQYFKWSLSKKEDSSVFDKRYTFRIICPTKAIATHGLRFSYLLLPKEHFERFDFILDNLSGSSNPFDIEFSKRCMRLLNSCESNNNLIIHTRNIFKELIDDNSICTEIEPDCGYFVFAKLNKLDKNLFTYMDQTYFEQREYEDYVRINLLNPDLRKIF